MAMGKGMVVVRTSRTSLTGEVTMGDWTKGGKNRNSRLKLIVKPVDDRTGSSLELAGESREKGMGAVWRISGPSKPSQQLL